MRRPGLAREQCRRGRLRHDDLHVGPGEFEHFAHARERAAGTPARNEVIQAPPREVAQDFRPGGVSVIGGIGRILELAGEEPAVFLCELLGRHSALRPDGDALDRDSDRILDRLRLDVGCRAHARPK